MKRITALFFVVLILSLSFGFSVSAAPTDAYTHSDKPGNSYSARVSRGMYEAKFQITASSLGLEESLSGLSDICSGPDGSFYILCGEDSRIIKLNEDYSLNCELRITDSQNNPVAFDGAKGVFIDAQNNIYICDTSNGRVLVANESGTVIRDWGAPQSDIIPKDFIYQPVSLSIDNDGYTYILSLGCYYGALVYSPEDEFIGFYGSNNVNAGALDTLAFIWDKLTGTDAKRAASIKELPYSFVDFALDDEGYMVVCNISEKESSSSKGQIRKIGPTGADILYKRESNGETVSSGAVGFAEGDGFIRNGSFKKQDFNSIDIDDNGFIYALDGTYGLVYVYDRECHLMNVFAGGFKKGNQLGVFNTPVALTVKADDILVADSEKNSVTVFSITDYGKLLQYADTLYINGDYSEAAPLWRQVLSMDRGNQLAYRGLAMNSYLEGNYKASLEYAKNGLDYSVYDLAWQAVLKGLINDYFIYIFLCIIVVIGAIAAFAVYAKKQSIVLVKNIKVKTLFQFPFHPFATFADIKYKRIGSLTISVVITLLLYITVVLKNIASGFLFTGVSLDSYNMFYSLLQTIGLLLLWSVSNWLVSSLFNGNGTFKEVYIATSYSLLPLVIVNAVRIILSHFLPLSGLEFINGVEIAVVIFVGFLLCIAVSSIHEFSFFKFLGTAFLTVCFMLLVVFIIFMFSTLLYQVFDLIGNLYTEIFYR